MLSFHLKAQFQHEIVEVIVGFYFLSIYIFCPDGNIRPGARQASALPLSYILGPGFDFNFISPFLYLTILGWEALENVTLQPLLLRNFWTGRILFKAESLSFYKTSNVWFTLFIRTVMKRTCMPWLSSTCKLICFMQFFKSKP